MKHIALIWGNDKTEPLYSTHHCYWEQALRDRSDLTVTRFTWQEWQTMPKDFDLYFFLDYHSSLFQLDRFPFHPRVFFWWDAFHYSFAFPAQLSEFFDKAYYAEYPTVYSLKNSGYYNVEWLPCSFYQKMFRPIPLVKANALYEFGFVGQQDTVISRKGLTRWEFLDKLTHEFNGYVGQSIFGETVNLVYNQSKVLFDRGIFCNIGNRIFEAVGAEGFFLKDTTKNYTGLDQLAKDGTHYVSYDGTYPDFEYKLKYYLKNSAERNQIAKQGCEYFLQHHTYDHRINTILKDMHLI